MTSLIIYLQTLPPIILSCMMFILAYGSVLLFGALGGKYGLYTIIVLLLISANIQVLKVTQFSFFSAPVALGTELFAATYLATDILAELYGKKAAKTGVYLGFMAMVFWSLTSMLTLGFSPISDPNNAIGIQQHLEAILYPFPTFLVASLAAYLISQLLDIYLFQAIKNKTNNKYLWIRNNVSTCVSSLVDNSIFSILAWIVLSSNPLPLSEVLKTYILGTYIFRVVAALLDTPILYLAKNIFPKSVQGSE